MVTPRRVCLQHDRVRPSSPALSVEGAGRQNLMSGLERPPGDLYGQGEARLSRFREHDVLAVAVRPEFVANDQPWPGRVHQDGHAVLDGNVCPARWQTDGHTQAIGVDRAGTAEESEYSHKQAGGEQGVKSKERQDRRGETNATRPTLRLNRCRLPFPRPAIVQMDSRSGLTDRYRAVAQPSPELT